MISRISRIRGMRVLVDLRGSKASMPKDKGKDKVMGKHSSYSSSSSKVNRASRGRGSKDSRGLLGRCGDVICALLRRCVLMIRY